jgi:hypothetical protein
MDKLAVQFSAHPGEIAPGILDALPGDGGGDVLVLAECILSADLIDNILVVLIPVVIQLVPLIGHKSVLDGETPVHPQVVDGDLSGGVLVQAVE